MTENDYAQLPYNDQISRLRLIRSSNIGPQTYHKLIEKFGSAEAALDALPSLSGHRKISICTKADAEKEYDGLTRLNGRFLFIGEPDYPLPLSVVPDAPPVLSTIGDTRLLSETIVGIVGARNASASSQKLARRFAEVLGDAGIVVASGLARGIDTAAHEGSLRGGTVAAFAGGVDVVYPRENEKLAAAIRLQGLILSETPLGTRPQARHFPRRNRIISGIASGILVVEAALKSGSLITAQYAADQGRDVFAVPGSPLDPRCRGSNDLIRKGAWLTETPDDIFRNLSNLSAFPPTARVKAPDQKPVTINAAITPQVDGNDIGTGTADERILQALSHTPIQVDELIRAVNLPASTVQESLLALELTGQLNRLPGGLISLAR